MCALLEDQKDQTDLSMWSLRINPNLRAHNSTVKSQRERKCEHCGVSSLLLKKTGDFIHQFEVRQYKFANATLLNTANQNLFRGSEKIKENEKFAVLGSKKGWHALIYTQLGYCRSL